MYKVCLIQNQSEMVHYRFADLRLFLENHNINYDLYTAENIETIISNFEKESYDAIIFSTNSLNDRMILSTIDQEPFKLLLDKHLSQNRGVLITSQLNYAKNRQDLNFMPIEKDSMRLMINPLQNNAKSIQFSNFAPNHLVFNFPHQITDSQIGTHALSSVDIKGLYWHTLHPDMEHWDVLLEDKAPLFALYKSKKIVMTSLLLDWQNHEHLLLNTLHFLMRKTLPIAFVYHDTITSDIHEYILRFLDVSQFEVVIYHIQNDLEKLKQRLSLQVHQIVLFANDYTLENLYETDASIKTMIEKNDVRAITLNYDKKSFILFGTSNSLYDIGLSLELYIKNELSTGYIEGSFWKSIEVLQSLEKLNPDFDHIYCKNLDSINHLLQKSIVNASYNETFQATCALLWYYKKLMRDEKNAQDTLAWLNQHIHQLSDHDYLFLAYYKHLSNVNDVDITTLKSKFNNLIENNPKDLDLSILLYVCYHYHFDVLDLEKVLSLLKATYQTNGWLNLFNTANISKILILLFHENRLDHDLRNILFDIIINLREFILKTTIKKNEFEIVSLIKAIEVCSFFEDLINFPTTELFKLIEPKNENFIVTKSDLMNAEAMRIDFFKMKQENAINKEKLKKLKYHNRFLIILMYLSFVCLYIIVAMFFFLNSNNHLSTVFRYVEKTWPYHIFLMPLGFGVIKFLITFYRTHDKSIPHQ